MAPGPVFSASMAISLRFERALGGKHRCRWNEGTSPRRGEVAEVTVTRVLGGKNPEKHAKITIFHPTPVPLRSRGSRNLPTAPDRFPFYHAALGQASHRIRFVDASAQNVVICAVFAYRTSLLQALQPETSEGQQAAPPGSPK